MVDWNGINMQSMYKEYKASITVQYQQYIHYNEIKNGER